MPVIVPLAQLSLAALRAVGAAFGRPAIRKWVLPIVAYEGASYLMEFFFFTMKVRAANFFIGRKDDTTESAAFLAWAEMTQSDVDSMSEREAQALVNRYMNMREEAVPGSRLGSALLDEPSHG